MLRLAKRTWVLLVVLIAAFCVDRFRGFFGHTPKVVKYEIFGAGSAATINYLDLDAQPQKAENSALPWTLTLTTTAPAASPNIIAQSDGDTITCRITVDGVVKDERTSDGVYAQTFCLVKSA